MTIDLHRRADAAVTYHDGRDIVRTLSPRPYLTATSPAGVALTDVGPADHRHHFGLSFAAPDVDGTSYWGGRTYVRDVGSTLLDNHGVQRVDSRELIDGRLTEQLTWLDRDDRPLLHEVRTITTEARETALEIAWRSRLTALDRPVSFGSPQTNGRPGAFYGGLFWRTPFASARVRTEDGEGIEAAHGSRSAWLAVEGAAATIVAVTTDDLPWFVRSDGYVGFGPALAVAERRPLDAGDTLDVNLSVALLDGACDEPEILVARMAAGAPTP